MTTTILTRTGQLLDHGAAELFPGYFAVVMATGATSIAAHLLGYTTLAKVLILANVLAYIVLWGLTFTRLFRYPGRLVTDLIDHSRGPGFFTLIAGTSILGSQFVVILDWIDVAYGLWCLATALWFLIMYAFFIAVTTREQKPTLDTGINGAWLLAAVSTHSVAILTALIPWMQGLDLALFFALAMYLIGCMLYLAIITLIFYRLTFLKVTGDSLTPPYWINMGAVAITTLAGATLIIQANNGNLLEDFLPFLKGFTLFFWATATWWIPLLIGLGFWRHVWLRYALRYEPALWSIVFPLAMYTMGTSRLADALDIEFLELIPQVSFWVALMAWLGASMAMVYHFGGIIVRGLKPGS